MARSAIPGLDVIEESGTRAVATRPYQPNFIMGGTGEPAGSGTRAVATRPYQPNFTMPGEMPGTGARQPFDYDAKPPSRTQQGLRAVRQAGAAALDKMPGSVKTAGRFLGKAAATGAAVSAIGDSTAEDSTARYAKRFGMDEPTGDGSIGDIAKFAGLRGLGFASDLGNALTGGLAGKYFADNEPGAMPAPSLRAPAVAAPNPPDQRLAAGAASPPMTPNVAGTIRRDGNSYSGTGDIKFGADIVNPDGSVRNGAGVTVLPSGPGGFGPGGSVLAPSFSAGNDMGFDTLGDMRRSGAGGLRANNGTLGGPRGAIPGELPAMPGSGGGAAGFGGGLGSSWQADRDRQNRETSFKSELSRIQNSNMKPRDKRHATSQLYEMYLGERRIESDQGIAGVRERGDMSRALISADTQRDISNRQIGAQTRGQDIAREGNLISAQGTRARIAYDMGKDQRDFQTGRADKALEQRSARESQLQKNLEAANTVMDSDGKPQVNARAVSEMRQGIDRAVARMGVAGVHELGPQAEQQLIAASSLLKTMRENAGYMPWNPDKLRTIDPYDLTGLKVLPNGDRQITRPGQAQGQIIPGRFFTTQEGARFFGGTPTNMYDMLSGGN